EFPALIDRITHGAYDAVYFGVSATDTDPAVNLDFWLSSGAFHVWHPGQTTAPTPWEAQIAPLRHQQIETSHQAERYLLVQHVQPIVSQEMPGLYWAAPNVIVATSARLVNAHRVLLQPLVLWSADTLAVQPEASSH